MARFYTSLSQKAQRRSRHRAILLINAAALSIVFFAYSRQSTDIRSFPNTVPDHEADAVDNKHSVVGANPEYDHEADAVDNEHSVVGANPEHDVDISEDAQPEHEEPAIIDEEKPPPEDHRLSSTPTATCDLITPLPDDPDQKPFCGPSVLVGGSMKCGTNAVGQLLVAHPNTIIKRCSDLPPGVPCNGTNAAGPASSTGFWEQPVFTKSVDRAARSWNLSQDDTVEDPRFQAYMHDLMPRVSPGSDLVSVWKAPSYLDVHIHPNASRLLNKVLPNIHVVMVLCEPVARIWSEYNHMKRTKDYGSMNLLEDCGANTFPQVVNAVLEGSQCKGIQLFRGRTLKGVYEPKVAFWKNAIGPRLHVTTLEHLQGENGKENTARLLDSLGLPSSKFDWGDTWTKWRGERYFSNNQGNAAGYKRNDVPAEVARKLFNIYKNSTKLLASKHGVEAAEDWLDAYE